MKALKFCFSVFFFLCSLFLFCFSAYASENSDDAISYDELNIIADRAVLTGQTQQMRVEEYSGTGTTLLVWTSSNPSVISCTPTGKITGIKEGQATITVKAIIGDGEDSITVYCAKRLTNPKIKEAQDPIIFISYEPKAFRIKSFYLNFLYYPPGCKTFFSCLHVLSSTLKEPTVHISMLNTKEMINNTMASYFNIVSMTA